MDHSQATVDAVSGKAARRTSALVPALAAALLGLFVLWGVGFAGPAVLHNAAHDARHSAAFPCH
jgi:cobalt transporter subunit CbtB